MTLQTPNGTPSFYTFPTFNPGKRRLIYGALLSIVIFAAVVFAFNFGTTETLHSAFDNAGYGMIDPSAISVQNSDAPSYQTVVPVTLPLEVLQALAGTYKEASSGATVSLTLQGRELTFQGVGLYAPLVPVSENKLLFRDGAERWIQFSGVEHGRVDALDFFDGRYHHAFRRQAQSPPLPTNERIA